MKTLKSVTILGINKKDGSQKILRRDVYATLTLQEEPYDVTPPSLKGIEEHLLSVYGSYAALLSNPTPEAIAQEHEFSPEELNAQLADNAYIPGRHLLTVDGRHDIVAIWEPDPKKNLRVHADLRIRRGKQGDESPHHTPSDPQEAILA